MGVASFQSSPSVEDPKERRFFQYPAVVSCQLPLERDGVLPERLQPGDGAGGVGGGGGEGCRAPRSQEKFLKSQSAWMQAGLEGNPDGEQE